MLKYILNNPKRLFVLVFIITIYGAYSGLTLPISMYPATSKPSVNMWVPYGTSSMDSFRQKYGSIIEGKIRAISEDKAEFEKLDAYYEERGAYFEVTFKWGSAFDESKSKLEEVSSTLSGLLPRDITDRIGIWQRNRNSGFLAASLYSDELSLRELYKKINPVLAPGLEQVKEAERATVWNPERYIISVNLLPEKMAVYNLSLAIVKRELKAALNSYSGSIVQVGKSTQNFEIRSSLNAFEDFQKYAINFKGKQIALKDIAVVDFSKDRQREKSFKTNGMSSLILFARPKSGANVKSMSEDVLKVLTDNKDNLPKSLKYKILVDPSRTIQNSINNLFKDVVLAAFMAVMVLFLFIGSFKSIATAAVEIPLSMVLSFILMKYFGMNLNLISLGGLALAAGMNVDASVVIMENIFKHRENWAKQGIPCDTFIERMNLVYGAVSEVALPVILSILTTLIVFIPMSLTTGLANAVLGDLARAVIFSHAISGFVALVIVPSVRVIVLKNFKPVKPPLEGVLIKLQNLHEKIMLLILKTPGAKLFAILLPIGVAIALVMAIMPNLPKEVIGKPDSDWVFMNINAHKTKSSRHMENIMQEFEGRVLETHGEKIMYTWFQRNNQKNGMLMFRLKQRSEMKYLVDKLKEEFKNTPDFNFYIDSWNPAELPLPKENHFRAIVKSDQKQDLAAIFDRLRRHLKEKDYYSRLNTQPGSSRSLTLEFDPYESVWSRYKASGGTLNLVDIAEVSKVSKEAILLGGMDFEGEMTDIKLSLNDKRYQELDKLKAFPIKLNEKLIPLSALGSFRAVKKPGKILVRDGQSIVELTGTLEGEGKKGWETKLIEVQKDLNENMSEIIRQSNGVVTFLPAQEELDHSLAELKDSLLISIALIFLVLWLQFQSVKQVGIIMMTIPLGLIGVTLSLYFFDSFLSLNSALGIILLNGITVNNSILLTDVINTLHAKGMRGKDLIITACKKRLRPILITSLTTVLGMFPIALGMGDGGKILQPLGIAVAGGLILATTLTLFVVPVLFYKKEDSIVQTQDDDTVKPGLTAINEPHASGVPLS